MNIHQITRTEMEEIFRDAWLRAYSISSQVTKEHVASQLAIDTRDYFAPLDQNKEHSEK